MVLKLTENIAMVTGSNRGIGLATAKAFAAEGCRLVLSARSAEMAEAEAVARKRCLGGPRADVSRPRRRQVWFRPLRHSAGSTSCNNVGGGGGGAHR